jgi:hypothetical protein
MRLSKRLVSLLALLFALALVVAPSMVDANDAGESECGVEGECANPEATVAIDPNCPDRNHVVRCAGEYLDKNKNGLLERSELQGAIDALPW